MKDERSLKTTDSLTLPGLTCKICLSRELGNDVSDRLVSPCECKGTMRYVHEECLLRWMKTKFEDRCELCNQPIKLQKKFKPIWKWKKPILKIWDIVWPVSSFIGLITAGVTLWASKGAEISHQANKALVPLALCTIFSALFLLTLTICINVKRIRMYFQSNQEWRISQSACHEIV